MKVVIESEQFNKTLKRMTHEIIERNDDLSKVVLIGIERKGTPIAKEIQALIQKFDGAFIPCEKISIDSHRDDNKRNETVKSVIASDLNDKVVILVDDVLFTGRTIRAAMDAIMDMGRPSRIELAVFIDRGHRELPIRADFVGKSIPTSKNELVVCDFETRTVSLN